jgi:hypothetical protein
MSAATSPLAGTVAVFFTGTVAVFFTGLGTAKIRAIPGLAGEGGHTIREELTGTFIPSEIL